MKSTSTCCDDEHDPHSLTVEQALQRIDENVQAITSYERVSLRDGLDRVIAQDIVAPFDIPPHRNSAMDGYAVNSADLAHDGDTELHLAGSSFAGKPFSGTLKKGQCVRIMTGAVMPKDTDTVIMQERVTVNGARITLQSGHTAGENLRYPGEDMKQGETVLEHGRLLTPADIGLLASMGIAEIDVLRRPRVAFFSTGDELKGLGQTLTEGDIYDSNRYTLYALLKRLPVDIIDMGVIGDQPQKIEQAFKQGASIADMVLTSGGVSVGDADYVKQLMEQLGSINFWKIAMKPGRPLAFGKLDKALFFGLPGNPVSVMATFALFARAAIQRLSGQTPHTPLLLPAICTHALKKRKGRTDFQRGIYHQDANGQLRVETTGMQSSHVLSAMSRANCFIRLERDAVDIPAGTEVRIILFSEIM